MGGVKLPSPAAKTKSCSGLKTCNTIFLLLRVIVVIAYRCAKIRQSAGWAKRWPRKHYQTCFLSHQTKRKKRIQAYEPVLFFYDRTKCTATLFFFGRYQFVSLTMNIDNFNLVIVFEMLTQLSDINIH